MLTVFDCYNKYMSILRELFTVSLSTIINIFLGFFTTPILTRIVDPTEYGRLTIFNTYVSIVTSFVYFGFNESLLRFYYTYKNDKERTSLLKLCFLIPILFSIAISITIIALFFINELNIVNIAIFNNLSSFFVVSLCINIVLTVWNTISTEMLQNTQSSKEYSIIVVIQKLTYTIIAVCLICLINRNHFVLLILATSLSLFISSLLGTLVTKKFWNFKNIVFPNNKNEILKYSLPMYFYFIVYSIYDTVDKILVDHYCSEAEVGIYSAAFSLVGVFAFVQTAFNIVWKPIQTEHYTNESDNTSLIMKGNRYITIVMFVAGISFIMFKDIICLLLGSSYRNCSTMIPFLVFNPIMNTLIFTVTSGIEKEKKSYLRFVIILISLIVLLVTSIILIPKIGAKGSSIAVAISLIVQYFLTSYISSKYYYVDYNNKKTLLTTIVCFIFAYINTFYATNIFTVITYLISLIIIYLVYKAEIIDMKNELFDILFNNK